MRSSPDCRPIRFGSSVGSGHSGGDNLMTDAPGFHDQVNDVVRIDRIDDMDSHLAVATMSFFRRLGSPHLYWERVAPTLEVGDSQVFLAARDRPWPPWGLGGRSVAAMCQIHPVGKNSFAVSPVYTAEEDATNIGLISAVYKEMLEELSRTEGTEVNYLVVEGSKFADRLLRGVGFEPSDDLQVTDLARYRFYRANAAKVLDALGLAQVSLPELLQSSAGRRHLRPGLGLLRRAPPGCRQPPAVRPDRARDHLDRRRSVRCEPPWRRTTEPADRAARCLRTWRRGRAARVARPVAA